MITTLVVIGLVVLTSISFLAGVTYTDYARDQANRLQAAERRELNAIISNMNKKLSQPESVTRIR